MGINRKSTTSRLKKSVLGRALGLFGKEEKKKVYLLIAAQILIGLFDIAGIILLGLVGALAVSGVESRGAGTHVEIVTRLLGISNKSFQFQVSTLAISAGIFLVAKSVISSYLTKRILRFLAYRGANISGVLAQKLLSQSIIEIRELTQQETIFALTSGVEELTLRVIGSLAIACADASLLVLLGALLLAYQPFVALSCFIFLMCIVFLLHRTVNKNAQKMGATLGRVDIESRERIVLGISSFRELAVRNQIGFLAQNITQSRLEMAESQAGLAFIPSIGKYVIETSVVLGALILSGVQFVITDASHAVATLTIFLAAGARVAPAILRLQQSYLTYKSNAPSALRTLDLAERLKSVQVKAANFADSRFVLDHDRFVPEVELNNVSLAYPSSSSLALRAVNLHISPGESVAIVGPSGAGKTSLVDVLLGLIVPTSGTVTVSGVSAEQAREISPGAIAYVPQNIVVANGTLKYNLTLGYELDAIPETSLWRALEMAELRTYVETLPNGLSEIIGERGTKLSGGQEQRLAIARALVSNPKLLVLDEATSALDADTESSLAHTISSLKGEMTVIMIAHRLSSVRAVDKVVYLDSGKVLAEGNFNQVRDAVPDFDRQARLMGL